MNDVKTEQLKQIRDEVLELTTSPLYAFRKKQGYFPVIGQGNHDASIMFIGEAPGRNEAMSGKPFCGAAGKILDELLSSVNIQRDSVYITNIVKDRPPQNRDPLPEEIAVYAPFLTRQIAIIQPSIIATLGRFSTAYLMEQYNLQHELQPMGILHGRVFELPLSAKPHYLIPLYHPAAAIYNRSLIDTLKKDMATLAHIYASLPQEH